LEGWVTDLSFEEPFLKILHILSLPESDGISILRYFSLYFLHVRLVMAISLSLILLDALHTILSTSVINVDENTIVPEGFVHKGTPHLFILLSVG
jgi:hypothetical protein